MKKLLAILLLAATSLFGQGISGSGTYADPWMLYTPANLDSMRYHVYQSDATAGYKIFELANDIDCDGVTFTSGDTLWHGLIISPQDTFGLDGNGYSIQNLDIAFDTTRHPITNANTDLRNGFIALYQGKVSGDYTVENDTIKNLTFDNANMYWDSTTAQSLDGFIGGILIGEWNEYLSEGDVSLRLENIKIKNSTLWHNKTSTSIVGALKFGLMIGYFRGDTQAGSGYNTMYRCGVDSSTIWSYVGRNANGYAVAGLVGQIENARIRIDEVYVKNTSITEDINPAYYEFSGAEVGGLFGQTNGNDILITNAYVYNITLHVNGVHGGASDEPMAGGMAGILNIRLTNTYVGAGTYIRDFPSPEANSDNLGFFAGERNAPNSSTQNFIDTTGLGTTDWYGVYGEESDVTPDTAIYSSPTDMQTQSTFTDENWDFTDIWAMSATINNNYPYLQWELPGVELTAPSGGETLAYPDTLWITWKATSGTDSIYIYYSLDNGFTYALADVEIAIADTFWIPIGLTSSQWKIRITTLDSSSVSTSGTFEYIGSVNVTILEPLGVAGIVNDGTYQDSIVVQSILADSVSLWYSVGDTLNWTLLVENISQPDLVDTVFWYWDPVPQVAGDIYIKAATEVDTSKYGPFHSTTVAIGSQRPANPAICWTATGSQYSIFRNFELDVSCGYSQPPLRHYSIWVDDNAEAYTDSYIACEQPCGIPVYPNNGAVFLFDAVPDTTETNYVDFYDQKGSTVTYKQRLYYIADSTLYMNDLRNGIDSIALVDLSTYYYAVSGVGWYQVNPTLSVYNVQWSKLNGLAFAVNTDFEALNDDGWAPKLVISGPGAPNSIYPGVTYDLLDSPPSGEYAEDVALAYSAFSYLRYYFRGIHPKIDKDR